MKGQYLLVCLDPLWQVSQYFTSKLLSRSQGNFNHAGGGGSSVVRGERVYYYSSCMDLHS